MVFCSMLCIDNLSNFTLICFPDGTCQTEHLRTYNMNVRNRSMMKEMLNDTEDKSFYLNVPDTVSLRWVMRGIAK